MTASGDTWAVFRWPKVVPSDTSPIHTVDSWFYRVSYHALINQIANYDDLNINNDDQPNKPDLTYNVTNLSPNTTYLFRFNVQHESNAGPVTLKNMKTSGKSLPKPTIKDLKVTPNSGTAIKLTWTLPDETKRTNWIYGVSINIKIWG